MSPDSFLSELAEILEVEKSDITLETRLENLEVWDSINVLSYMMLVDEKLGRQVDPEAVKKSETLQDLYNLAVA